MVLEGLMESEASAVNLRVLSQEGYSRWETLRHFIPLCRENCRLREIEGRFPKRVQLSPRCVAWSNAEIRRWLESPETYRSGESSGDKK